MRRFRTKPARLLGLSVETSPFFGPAPQAGAPAFLDLSTMATVDSSDGATPKVEAGSSNDWQVNIQLKEENRKLRELIEYRSAQIAHLGHELRTPLTSILGFAEILLGHEELTDAQRNFCERIQNSARQLQRTLNELADLSRLDIVPDDVASRESADK